jgi:outer membrane protein TolC
MFAPALGLLLAAPSAAATFAELADATRTTGTTAQVVALDARTSRAGVASAVSRLLPDLSLSDQLTWTTLNTDRFQREGESAEACAERLGRTCEQLLSQGGSFTIPGETVNHTLSLVGTQSLWSTRAVLGVAQAGTRRRRSDAEGQVRVDQAAGALVGACVDLQAAVEALRLSREALQVAEADLAAARAAHAAGEATDLDRDLAALGVEEARLDVQQGERALPRLLEQLWETAGAREARSQRVCPLLAVPDGAGPVDLGAAPTLELARQQAVLDEQGLWESRLSFLPTVAAVGGVSAAGRGEDLGAAAGDFAQTSWFVGATASWTLLSGGSRAIDLRTSAWSVQRSALTLEQDTRDLALRDAEAAAQLRDLAEDLDLLRRQLSLQARQLAATESRYRDGGRPPSTRCCRPGGP